MLRACGIGFPNGAVDNSAVFVLPSADLLMLSTEGRYHYDAAVRAGKRCLWRAVPRIGKRPAELGWSPSRFVAESINLADAPELPITDFIPWNELDLQDERGDKQDDWQGLDKRYALIGGWGLSVVHGLRAWSQDTRIHWPAFTPDHDAKNYFDAWAPAAYACDVVDFHAYDSLDRIETAYRNYRFMFPEKPLCLTEWHCRGDLEEERRVLQWLAETMAADPLFEAAYFFIWRWHDAPGWWSDAWDIEHNPERLALFLNPPTINLPAPAPAPEPVPEVPAMPERDPYEFFTAIEIANAAALAVSDVRANWPRLHAQLVLCGIADRPVQIGMIGTAAVESGMRPIHEYGTEADWAGYEGGAAYAGRGFIQRTHRRGYELAGRKIAELWQTDPNQPDFDLVTNPDNLLDPDLAAADAAIFFRDTKTLQGYGIVDACRAQDWEWVRRLVLGGPDPAGTARIARVAAALSGPSVPVAPPDTARVTYNANEPAIAQDDPWSCSSTSLRWALTALGRHPAESWIEGTMKAEGVVTEADGLLDATGKGLAEFVTRQYGEFGFYANNESQVSFDALAAEFAPGCRYGGLIGGRAWGHWSGLKGYSPEQDCLLLANPSENWKGVGQTMNRQQFDALGPFSMVRVLHPDLLDAAPVPEPQPEPAPEPQPAPTPEPVPSRARVLVSEIKDRLDELARLVA